MAETDPRPEVLRAIELFAADLLGNDLLDSLVADLNTQLVAEIPEVAADAGIRRDLDVSTHDLLGEFLAQSAKDPLVDLAFPPAAVDFARTLAKRGYDTGLLLRLYRVGQRVFWSRLMAEITERVADPDVRMAVLQFAWDRMSRTLERNLDMLVAAHTEEREQRLRGALLRRHETVQAILREEQVDIDTAIADLGHDLRRWQTALVLWADEYTEGQDAAEHLEAVAIEIAAAAGSTTPLTVRSGVRVVWAWLATTRPPRPDAIAGSALSSRNPSVRVAAGAPARGIRGFRRSHREALRAQGVAVEGARGDTVTYYPDVEIASCLAADDDAMRGFVERELAGLAGRGAGHERLRRTALVYLGVGGGARAAAVRLGVHKNTVLYRLRQVEELLGRRVTERRLALELALMLVDVYGERVLPPAHARPQ